MPNTNDITPLGHFHRNIYKAVCLHLGLYCGIDVTMVADEVNKFGIRTNFPYS
jgi:hypothetical protein